MSLDSSWNTREAARTNYTQNSKSVLLSCSQWATAVETAWLDKLASQGGEGTGALIFVEATSNGSRVGRQRMPGVKMSFDFQERNITTHKTECFVLRKSITP